MLLPGSSDAGRANRHEFSEAKRKNGATGRSDIEGKGARVAPSELGSE
jgi:hypothetical protein